MSRLTQFAGGRAPSTTLIVNKYSGGGVSDINMGFGIGGSVLATSGSGTGGVLTTVLNITGSGYVPFLVAYSNSVVPSHTVRCKVIVDGTSVFDATSDTIAADKKGMCIVNTIPVDSTYSVPCGVPIRFNTSCVVQVASSQSGTDYVAIRYDYHKTAY